MFKTLPNLLILLVLCCLAVSQTLKAEDPQVKFSFNDDGRKWSLAFKDSNEDQKIFEYLPENAKLDNWVDLTTVQYMNGPNIPAKTYYTKFMEALKKSAPYNKVQSKLISEDKNSVFWEWWIADNSQLDQHEWIRVFVDGENTAFLRYTTKDSKNVEKYRKIWQKIISDATFENAPQPASQTPALQENERN